jgi:hypothetical protein
VESRVGEGATFTAYLPSRLRVTAPASIEPPVANGAVDTVLLVDHEPALVRRWAEIQRRGDAMLSRMREERSESRNIEEDWP